MEEEQHCFHPDAPNGCSAKGPIKSHSVSKGLSLAAIAEDGHVVSITKPFEEIVFQDKAIVEQSGVNVSSVFPGFCQAHDNKLFDLIEREGWIISKDSCFLLSYRSLSHTVLKSRVRARYLEHINRFHVERSSLID